MCRATSDRAARRCPCSHGEQRSAVDRARNAAKVAARATTDQIVTPAGPVDLTAPDLKALAQTATAGFVTSGQRSQINETLGLGDARLELLEARRVYSADRSLENQAAIEASDAKVAAIREQIAAWEATLPTREEAEAAVVQIGAAVAGRAEQLAGITADEALADYQQRLSDALATERELDVLVADYRTELHLDDVRTAWDDAARALANAYKTPNLEAASVAMKEAGDAYKVAYAKLTAFRKEHDAQQIEQTARDIASGSDDVTLDHQRRLAAGYRQAIAEIRPTGGTLQFDAATKDDVAGIFNRATDVYPTEWIDASNRVQAPWARASGRRAHYVASRNITTKKRVPITMLYETTHDDTDPYESLGLDRSVAEIVVDPDPDQRNYGRQMWQVTEYERFSAYNHRSRDGKPVGPGWEQITYTQSWSGEENTVWRRKKYQMKTVASRSAPEITTNSERSTIGAPGGETATHELAHRMEGVVPMIGQMESAFVERRTTRPDGTHAPRFTLDGTRDEYARDGGFVHPYIGRDYSSQVHFEVMSVGAESLFHGSHGGLIGLSKSTPPDLDHRAFVLGVLATATR